MKKIDRSERNALLVATMMFSIFVTIWIATGVWLPTALFLTVVLCLALPLILRYIWGEDD